jgi:hypothetical protein
MWRSSRPRYSALWRVRPRRHISAGATFMSKCGQPHFEMSLYVVRAFVQLRDLLASNAELARRLDELERTLEGHDEAIAAILAAIRELMSPPEPKLRGIEFTADVEPQDHQAGG